MRRFKGKVAIITGGAAGIGLATARRIASEGGRITLLDWSGEDLERAQRLLSEAGAECEGVRGSVAAMDDCERAVAQAQQRWGRVDVLVANAGVRASGSLLEAADADWESILSVNLRGVANACVAAAKAMRAGGTGGAMVLISSMNAFVGRRAMPIYDAAKAGVVSLARSLAVDLAEDRIRVNSVCPGFTVTDYHIRRAAAAGRTADDLRATSSGLFKRPAEPEELAAAIAFLASDDASYITATNLMVDAGRHAT
jgi:meso-butanediol dehydrogenase/(S,S)-butanediol dehydrogenase/diacetyl reductase